MGCHGNGCPRRGLSRGERSKTRSGGALLTREVQTVGSTAAIAPPGGRKGGRGRGRGRGISSGHSTSQSLRWCESQWPDVSKSVRLVNHRAPSGVASE
eukprot:116340-Pelagomonas_calceolata.AAC.3